jgi:NADPH-dependent glutamate synthase beta subunit-like oxidoreductase
VTHVARADGEKDCSQTSTSHARWLVNDDPEPFDAIIVNVGTCGKPKRARFPGMPSQSNGHDASHDSSEESEDGKREGHSTYEGPVIHSSELDDADVRGKTVVVIGSGASGVEAVETALAKGAKKGVFIARSDKASLFQTSPLRSSTYPSVA